MTDRQTMIERLRTLIFFVILSVLLTWVLSSCQQHELCYDHNHYSDLHVCYDWRNAGDGKPKSMYLFMYPDDGGRTVMRDWAGHEGGDIALRNFTGYDAVSVNSDNENIVVDKGDDADGAVVTTRKARFIAQIGLDVSDLPVARSTEEMPFKTETDSVWVASSDERVFLGDGEADGERTLTLTPRRAWVTCHVTIHNVENWGKIASGVAASLSGLCGSVKASDGSKTDETVIVPFAMRLDKGTASMEGTMTCFGRSVREDVPNKLMVYMTLKDGSKWSYVYDVTSMVRKEEGHLRIEVDIDNLPVPDVAGGNGGMDPGVSDWNVIYIPIKM